MRRDPVWITGVGAATPLGATYRDIADNLLAGRSGVSAVTAFSSDAHPSRIAARLEAPPCPAGTRRRVCPGTLPSDALWCGNRLQDAGLFGAATVCAASSSARLPNGTDLGDGLLPRERRLSQADFVPGPPVCAPRPAGPMGLSRRRAQFHYHRSHKKWQARLGRLLPRRRMTSPSHASDLAGFGLRALSRRNTSSARPPPLVKDRDGFVLGGAARSSSEPSSARAAARPRLRRSRRPRRHQRRLAWSSPVPTPARRQGWPRLTRPRPTRHVDCARPATSTSVGDVAETRVLHSVFGSHIRSLPVSSTKSMTGHLLTAAAAFEALACIVALERQAIPPTINLENPDPECDLCHVANQAQERPVRLTASNSFGFGGSNTCLVLRQAA